MPARWLCLCGPVPRSLRCKAGAGPCPPGGLTYWPSPRHCTHRMQMHSPRTVVSFMYKVPNSPGLWGQHLLNLDLEGTNDCRM